MTKPLNENIRDVKIETEDGDLIPVLDHAGSEFARVINAVVSTNKAGSITLKIDAKPSTAGALAIKAVVTTKTPKGLPPESLMWPTPASWCGQLPWRCSSRWSLATRRLKSG